MRNKIIALVLPMFFLVSCGGAYTMSVQPIQIEVTHKFDISEIQNVFAAQCARDLGPTATPDMITQCSEAKVADFIDVLANLGK